MMKTETSQSKKVVSEQKIGPRFIFKKCKPKKMVEWNNKTSK